MAKLLDKFKKMRLPNWMSAEKRDYPLPPISAANDNEKNLYESEAIDVSGFYLSVPCYLAVINLRKHPKLIKLKLSASVKRRLRRNKNNYRKVREWLDEAEKHVNQTLFGADGYER